MQLSSGWTRNLPSAEQLLRTFGLQGRPSEVMRDWSRAMPSRDELLHAIGLEARRSTSADVAASLALFGAGVLVGAALAVLLAPTSGEELRHELKERVSEWGARTTAHA